MSKKELQTELQTAGINQATAQARLFNALNMLINLNDIYEETNNVSSSK